MATIVISLKTSFLIKGGATDLTWQVLRLVYGRIVPSSIERQISRLGEYHLLTNFFIASAITVDFKEFLHLGNDNGPSRVNFRLSPAAVIIAFKGQPLILFFILGKLRVYEEHWWFENLFIILDRLYV